ncbi:MAG: CRISPR-associated helicase Cas3' [Anaerolineae bacterium]
MPRIKAEVKERRKERIWMLVRQHNGIRQIELAELSGFENRTVYNYLSELEQEGKVYKEGLLWFDYPYHQGTQLRRFELFPEEAYTLYLAARLFVKQSDKRNEYAESALYRLAEVLKSDIPVSPDIQAAAQKLAQREIQPGYHDIFQTLIRAYLQRHKVRLTYKPLWGKSFETTFAIYLIEPSAIGFATYLIGHSALIDKIRVYKMGRVQAVEVLRDDTYSIPENFPGLTIFDTAWSIITGEKTTRIVLRFSDKVAARVLETNWHPSQDYAWDEEKKGYLRWWVDVADTIDIFPWIRGWGQDVEILEPVSLRQQMEKQVQTLSEIYSLRPPVERLPYQLLYAKSKNGTHIHLLLYHLIDVGQVALALWNEVLAEGFKRDVAHLVGLTGTETGRFLAFLAALHDLGKAGPAYQDKYAPAALEQKLKEAGMPVAEDYDYNQKTKDTPHATVTTWALPQLLVEYCGLEQNFAKKIGVALGGHHGAWPAPGATQGIEDKAFPVWAQVRRDLFWEMRSVFQPPTVSAELSYEQINIVLTLLSGLTSVADWVGSNEDYFLLVDEPMSTRAYADLAAQRAQHALKDLGWFGWQPDGHTLTFAEMFAYLNPNKPFEPHTVQAEVMALAADVEPPALLILESLTGSGKTEVSLYQADKWLQTYDGRGLYIAMPTQATSNQMFDRSLNFLEHRYPDQQINTLLLHGQAAFDEKIVEMRLNTVGDNESAGIVAMSWFMQKSKRTLLAPFGVGTVDQALLSVLQTKHFFVRLFGLSHKVIIFDEVHAYDTYMNTLFEHLLTWLRAVGTSVIILSATLPAATRQRLVKAYTGQDLPPPDEATPSPYPALTIAGANQSPQTLPLTPPRDTTIGLHWLKSDWPNIKNRDPQNIVSFLQAELAEGGCAAVICNTVKRAQEVYLALKAANLNIPKDDLILFHARYPAAWRKEREDKVIKKFGKPDDEEGDHRPRKAIVVATQVIEQSLDLDFDVMITDLAPIDLLIQRAGRLHRHPFRDAARPKHLTRRLVITQPDLHEQSPDFGNDVFVYERYILLQTYRLLQNETEITLPGQTVALIEGVYGRKPDADDAEVVQAYREMMRNNHTAHIKAQKQLVGDVTDFQLLYQTNLGLDEDNPAVHQSFRAKTRDIALGVSLICLHQTETKLLLDPDKPDTACDLEVVPNAEQTREFLRRMLTVQNWVLVNHFADQAVPSGWHKNAVLRHTRPVIFENGTYIFTHTQNGKEQTFILSLDPDLGLQLQKEDV